MSSVDTTTEVLTIEEAAVILRISRNAAYAAARPASPASRSAERSGSPEPTSIASWATTTVLR